ncbi:MAG: SdpI family protein [Clostridia bacterium]|nr:SdpI family protein [Clostridia bacterium]
MGFWIYIVFTDMMIPVLMTVFGLIFMHRVPVKINSIYGYRTRRSMKNKDTWAFAHKHIAKSWLRVGIITAVLSFIILLMLYGKSEETVGNIGLAVCIVQIAVMVISIIPTEVALHKTFDSDGKRRN